jgi:hypothetical protein
VCLVQLAWANLVHCIVFNCVVSEACATFGQALLDEAGLRPPPASNTSEDFVGGVARKVLTAATTVVDAHACHFTVPATSLCLQLHNKQVTTVVDAHTRLQLHCACHRDGGARECCAWL